MPFLCRSKLPLGASSERREASAGRLKAIDIGEHTIPRRASRPQNPRNSGQADER